MAKIFQVSARAGMAHVIEPIARGLLRRGVTPNMVTVAGTVGAVTCSIAFGANGYLFIGARDRHAVRADRPARRHDGPARAAGPPGSARSSTRRWTGSSTARSSARCCTSSPGPATCGASWRPGSAWSSAARLVREGPGRGPRHDRQRGHRRAGGAADPRRRRRAVLRPRRRLGAGDARCGSWPRSPRSPWASGWCTSTGRPGSIDRPTGRPAPAGSRTAGPPGRVPTAGRGPAGPQRAGPRRSAGPGMSVVDRGYAAAWRLVRALPAPVAAGLFRAAPTARTSAAARAPPGCAPTCARWSAPTCPTSELDDARPAGAALVRPLLDGGVPAAVADPRAEPRRVPPGARPPARRERRGRGRLDRRAAARRQLGRRRRVGRREGLADHHRRRAAQARGGLRAVPRVPPGPGHGDRPADGRRPAAARRAGRPAGQGARGAAARRP